MPRIGWRQIATVMRGVQRPSDEPNSPPKVSPNPRKEVMPSEKTGPVPIA